MKLRMKCPLTDGIIDSDLCYEVQECIEGDTPVTLELEDFLEKKNCKEICRKCECNVIYDQINDEDTQSSTDENVKEELTSIINKLDQYRIRLSEMADEAQNEYDQMSDEQKESEDGDKQDRLISALYLATNYLEDIVKVFDEHIDNLITETDE